MHRPGDILSKYRKVAFLFECVLLMSGSDEGWYMLDAHGSPTQDTLTFLSRNYPAHTCAGCRLGLHIRSYGFPNKSATLKSSILHISDDVPLFLQLGACVDYSDSWKLIQQAAVARLRGRISPNGQVWIKIWKPSVVTRPRCWGPVASCARRPRGPCQALGLWFFSKKIGCWWLAQCPLFDFLVKNRDQQMKK